MFRSRTVIRLLFCLCLTLVVGTVTSLLLVSQMMRDDMEARVYQGLEANIRNASAAIRMLGAAPEIYRGKLYLGGTLVNGNNTLVDEMSESLGVNATIFLRDEAVATTLRDSNNQRKLGFRMETSPGRRAVFMEHKPFHGVEMIGDEPYYVAYAPLIDRWGELVGAVQVALPHSAALARADALRVGAIVLAVGSLLALSLLFLLYGRHMAGHVSRQEKVLDAATGHLDMALENMANGIGVFGPDHRLVLASNHYVDVLGLSPGTLSPGMTLAEVLTAVLGAGQGGAAGMAKLCEQLLARLADHCSPGDLEYPWKGRLIAVRHRTMPNGGWLVTYEDVTERRKAEQEILHLARHDPLTDLANRTTFNERLGEVLDSGEPAAVMMFDLDHFSGVNNTLGHPVGDMLLRQVASRLREHVQPKDLVARLGGDEFAVLHTGIPDAQAAAETAERLVQTLCEPFEVDGQPIRISTSVGVTLPSPGTDAATLMKEADMALYRAKGSGRNTHAFYEPGMGEDLRRRKSLEDDLRSAVIGEQFELFYQPLVNARSCKLVGFEALLRWRHPVMGLVPPAEFIPIAEQTGLIIRIGAWVLRRACRDAAKWPGLKIAVNLSPVQFRDPHLLAAVQGGLAASKLPPNLLELEITETALVNDETMVVDMLTRLRALGIRIAMDDFGTGYSSLAYFHRFPFDKVKVDRMFVEGIGQRRDCDAIVNAVVGIGAELGMTTLAEGVETADQLRKLREKGVQELQGYFFSKPMPFAATAQIIRQIGVHNPEAAPQEHAPTLYAEHLSQSRGMTGHDQPA